MLNDDVVKREDWDDGILTLKCGGIFALSAIVSDLRSQMYLFMPPDSPEDPFCILTLPQTINQTCLTEL